MNEAPKKSFYILFAIACFLGAILFNLTDLTILARSLIAGQNYNFFSFASGDARGTLLPAYRDILYGNWSGSDGMTYENIYLPAVRPYFNYWLLSPLVLLFKSYNIYLPLGRFLMAILVFILVYKLAKYLIGNRYGSLLFSLVFLSGGYIFSFFFPWSSGNFSIVTRSFLPFGSSAAEVLLSMYNSVSTFPGLAILAASFLFLYLAIVSDKKRYTILAGIFSGLALNNYPTSGLYVWAVSGVMFLIFIFRKDFVSVKKILWVYALSAIVGLPFFINQSSLRMLPWADEVYRRVGGEMVRGFRTSQWFNYILFIVFAAWLWRWGKSHNREKEATYLVACMLSPILLLNMQIITGYNPVGSEWFNHQFYFGFAFCWLILFYEIYIWVKNKNKKFANIALAVIIILFIGRAVQASIVKSNLYKYNYLPKGLETSFKWLNKNTELNSVVISPSLVMNYLFADETHNRILITSGTNSSMPQWEIMDRWFVLYKIFGVSSDYLEQALRGRLPKSSDLAAGAEYDLMQGGDNGLTGAMFYYYFGDRSLDSYFRSQQTDVPDGELAKIISDYKKYPADLCYLLSKYRVDYLYIGPLDRTIISIDVDKLNWLNKVYDSDNIKIYKIQKDVVSSKCKR